jgi:hypothetical protein
MDTSTSSSLSQHASSSSHEQNTADDEHEHETDVDDDDPDTTILAQRRKDGVTMIPTSIQCICTSFTHDEYRLTDHIKVLTRAERHNQK